MARIRTIKPDFWKHEGLSTLPEPTHMLAAALLNYADDEGYFNANPSLVKAECSPLREPSVSIHGSLNELSRVGYIRLGHTTDGRSFGHVVQFLEHQRVSHPTKSKIKDLEIVWEDSRNPHGGLTEASALNRIEEELKGREVRADARATEFAFAGNVVRLNLKDFEQWQKSFSKLDLLAELTARDAWLASEEANDEDRRKWFISTSKYLANRNMLAGQKPTANDPYAGAI